MRLEEAKTFLRAIIENPNNDSYRLVFADWLEEQGQQNLALFIRAQCAFTPLYEAGNSEYRNYAQRQSELFLVHGQEWEEPLRAFGVTQITFHKGLPAAIIIALNSFFYNAEKIFELGPLTSLSLVAQVSEHPTNPSSIHRLTQIPHLSRLEHFSIQGIHIDTQAAQLLADSPYYEKLRHLHLQHNSLGNESLIRLLSSGWVSNLEAFSVLENHLGDAAADALSRIPFTRLIDLSLENNRIGPRGIQALVESESVRNLKRLNLGSNPILDEGAAAVGSSTNLGTLRHLALDNTQISVDGAILLVQSELLSELQSLCLERNGLGFVFEEQIRRQLESRQHRGNERNFV